jgi:hypothetical protein
MIGLPPRKKEWREIVPYRVRSGAAIIAAYGTLSDRPRNYQLYSELNFENASQNGSSRCLIVVGPARWW